MGTRNGTQFGEFNPELDQKVADHVAAVKKRRVEKAQAKADAEELLAQSTPPPAKNAKGSKAADKASAKTAAKPAAEVKPSPESKKKTVAEKTAATKTEVANADSGKAGDTKSPATKPAPQKPVPQKP